MAEVKRESPSRLIEMLDYNPTGQAFQLDPERHRHFLEDPAILKKFKALRKEESLYGVSYLINKVEPEQGFEIMKSPAIGIDQLLAFQKRRTYLSRDLLSGRSDELVRGREWQFLNILVAAYSDANLDSRPDTSRSFLPLAARSNESRDEWVNMALAYKLAQGHFPELALTDVDRLQEYAEGLGQSVAWRTLYSGLINLTGTTIIKELGRRGLLKKHDKNFYSQAARLLTGAAEKISFGPKLHLTAPYAYYVKDLPPIDLLPPLARGVCELLTDIPLNLKEGQEAPPQYLAHYVLQFRDFALNVIQNQKGSRKLNSQEEKMIVEASAWLNQAGKIIHRLADQPTLLIKTTLKQTTISDESYARSINDIVEEIRQAGGRAPKRLSYDLSYHLMGRD